MDDAAAQRVDDAVAAEQSHWRAIVAELQATVTQQALELIGLKVALAIQAEQKDE